MPRASTQRQKTLMALTILARDDAYVLDAQRHNITRIAEWGASFEQCCFDINIMFT